MVVVGVDDGDEGDEGKDEEEEEVGGLHGGGGGGILWVWYVIAGLFGGLGLAEMVG